ncbi:hypothetical protein ATANTOWER_011157 [Ataeniobius toweri]|uniref:Uncharacterized protein n=1 Tax=Ataeniobius toweri TaxID=208326 RepID=A0ABU7AEH7_9TELE|nr:hypothetical protein [Ataeniobius toweri]
MNHAEELSGCSFATLQIVTRLLKWRGCVQQGIAPPAVIIAEVSKPITVNQLKQESSNFITFKEKAGSWRSASSLKAQASHHISLCCREHHDEHPHLAFIGNHDGADSLGTRWHLKLLPENHRHKSSSRLAEELLCGGSIIMHSKCSGIHNNHGEKNLCQPDQCVDKDQHGVSGWKELAAKTYNLKTAAPMTGTQLTPIPLLKHKGSIYNLSS